MMKPPVRCWICALLAALCAGCGGGDAPAPVAVPRVIEFYGDSLTFGSIAGPDGTLTRLSVDSRRAQPHRLALVAMAGAGINVSQLHLETDAGIGVAVIDLSVSPDDRTLDALRGVDGTVAAFMALAATH